MARASRSARVRMAVAYAYLAPFFLLFLLFGLFPILYSLALSLTYWKGVGRPIFVFLDNYRSLFANPVFYKALYNTAYIFVIAHLIMLPGAFILAYLLNTEYVKSKNLFQAMIFTPMVTSTIAVSLVFTSIFGEQFGVINFFLRSLGAPPAQWFHGDGGLVKPVIIVLFVWKWIGWNCVIYSAGMQGIDQELYECAKVEGANKLDILRFITLPLMKPVILYTLILSFVGGMQIFDEPYILTGSSNSYFGGANQAGMTIALLLYEAGFRRGAFGQASAIAYVLMVLIVVLSALSFRLFNGCSREGRDA
jgi:cellobiose transport system permease protein